MAPQIAKETLIDLKAGSLTAFEKIAYDYEGPILNYIWRMVKRKEDAEDLTQETFIHVYKNLNQINPDGNFRAWVYRIATNTVFDWLRKKNRAREVPLFIDATNTEKNYDELLDQLPTYTMSDIENKSDVTKALGKISSQHQLILILFYYHELSCREIGDILSIPTGTVKTRLYKARQVLKKALFEQGFEITGAGRAKEEYGLSLSKN